MYQTFLVVSILYIMSDLHIDHVFWTIVMSLFISALDENSIHPTFT